MVMAGNQGMVTNMKCLIMEQKSPLQMRESEKGWTKQCPDNEGSHHCSAEMPSIAIVQQHIDVSNASNFDSVASKLKEATEIVLE
ncbi:hypothetical protein QYF36_012360 [Acer negundo]|nr:hypothetical protein QYF36_012360 [Acer negundo]